MNDRIENAINKIEKSLNKTELNLSFLNLTTEDLIYILSIEKYQGYFANLEELNLSRNNLINLPENILDNLVNLEILDLQHNNLSTLPEKMLDKLVNLAILYLDKSNLALPEKIKNKKGLQIYY